MSDFVGALIENPKDKMIGTLLGLLIGIGGSWWYHVNEPGHPLMAVQVENINKSIDEASGERAALLTAVNANTAATSALAAQVNLLVRQGRGGQDDEAPN